MRGELVNGGSDGGVGKGREGRRGGGGLCGHAGGRGDGMVEGGGEVKVSRGGGWSEDEEVN